MKNFKLYIIPILLIITQSSFAKPLKITSSIYPIQQIVNSIYGEHTNVLIKGTQSPHDFFLKPSDASAIENSDLLIWVGDSLSPKLEPYIHNRKKPTLTLLDIPDLEIISADHNHSHNEHEHEHEHEHKKFINPHIWLSTNNAKIIAKKIYQQIILLDPKNQAKYQDNLQHFLAELKETQKAISLIVKPLKNKKYYIYHDAYAYFEDSFNLMHQGVIRIDPSKSLRSKQIYQLKAQIDIEKKGCIFQEPQFSSKIVEQLTKNTAIKISTLDPIGYNDKQTGYSAILFNIANNMHDCLLD